LDLPTLGHSRPISGHRRPRLVHRRVMTFSDHFSAFAARYAEFRPRYPAALVAELAELAVRHDVAWDVGCGNGQLSIALATFFSRVIATDPSRAQLDAAERNPRVDYRCEPAEASSIEAASLDLVVAAQAAHWFDWPRFVAEVGRVAKPGALVALVSYGNPSIDGDAGEAIARYRDAVASYWPRGREHVENGYRDLTMPWPTVDAPEIAMTELWTRDELFGYVTTWSSTNRRIADKGSGELENLHARLVEIWPDGERREVRWPLTVKLARV
jgi:SAM-dependent methyltransferase